MDEKGGIRFFTGLVEALDEDNPAVASTIKHYIAIAEAAGDSAAAYAREKLSEYEKSLGN